MDTLRIISYALLGIATVAGLFSFARQYFWPDAAPLSKRFSLSIGMVLILGGVLFGWVRF
jgi:hypothetical protein